MYNKEKKIESDVNKSIAQLQRKLIVLNETLVGKKGYKENLGKENIIAQVQFVQNLKVISFSFNLLSESQNLLNFGVQFYAINNFLKYFYYIIHSFQ